MSVGARVREIRESRGISSQELAHSAGMRTKFLEDIEDDLIPRVNVLTLQKLADLLNVRVEYFTGDEEIPKNLRFEDEIPDKYRGLILFTVGAVITLGTACLVLIFVILGAFGFRVIQEIIKSYLG